MEVLLPWSETALLVHTRPVVVFIIGFFDRVQCIREWNIRYSKDNSTPQRVFNYIQLHVLMRICTNYFWWQVPRESTKDSMKNLLPRQFPPWKFPTPNNCPEAVSIPKNFPSDKSCPGQFPIGQWTIPIQDYIHLGRFRPWELPPRKRLVLENFLGMNCPVVIIRYSTLHVVSRTIARLIDYFRGN